MTVRPPIFTSARLRPQRQIEQFVNLLPLVTPSGGNPFVPIDTVTQRRPPQWALFEQFVNLLPLGAPAAGDPLLPVDTMPVRLPLRPALFEQFVNLLPLVTPPGGNPFVPIGTVTQRRPPARALFEQFVNRLPLVTPPAAPFRPIEIMPSARPRLARGGSRWPEQFLNLNLLPLLTPEVHSTVLSQSHIFLIEMQGHDGASLLSFYLSTRDWMSDPHDSPANQLYMSRVKDPGNFERHLFSSGTTRGQSATAAGDIILVNGSPGNGETLDAWLDYGFDGRPITIKALPVNARQLSAATVVFSGKVDHITSTRPLDQLEIKLSDLLSDLNLPLLTTRFAGTTTSSAATAEGNADLSGRIKQQVWGTVSNVELQPANVYDLIYLACNNAAISIVVYDGGIALTPDGDFADIAALQAATTLVPGHYATCLSAGLVRLGGPPQFAVTANIVEGANAAARTAAQIVKRILTGFGISPSVIAGASFSALDTLNASICGLLIDDDTTALAACQKVLDSIGGALLPNRLGFYEVDRFDAPAAGGTVYERYQISAFELVETEIPVWRINLQYSPVHHVQGDAELAGAVDAPTRAFLATEYRTITVENASVKTKHLKAGELTVTTQLTSLTAATAEANRLLALYSAERKIYRVTLPLADAWLEEPGHDLTLKMPRLGMTAGKDFTVIGRQDNYAKENITLTVWG